MADCLANQGFEWETTPMSVNEHEDLKNYAKDSDMAGCSFSQTTWNRRNIQNRILLRVLRI